MPANHQEEASWWKVNISCFALIFSVEADHVLTGPQGRSNPTYTLDGIPFFMVPITDVPPGYCEVDVIVNDNGVELDCMMVAGHVAFSGSSAAGSKAIDTVSPSAQWFMFEKK